MYVGHVDAVVAQALLHESQERSDIIRVQLLEPRSRRHKRETNLVKQRTDLIGRVREGGQRMHNQDDIMHVALVGAAATALLHWFTVAMDCGK